MAGESDENMECGGTAVLELMQILGWVVFCLAN